MCPLCSNKVCTIVDSRIRDLSSEDIKIYQCSKCGVQFLYPQKSEEELKRYYDGNYRKAYVDENYYDKDYIRTYFERQLPEAKKRVERLKEDLAMNDRVLEIGCSSGYFLSTVSPYVKMVCGTEWDSKNSEYVKGLGFDVKQNIEEYDNSFDKIFMFHVLEHIKEPIEFLASLKTHLKPDGKIYIEVPNNEDVLLSGYNLQEFKDFYYQSAHLWYFNKKSLEHILAQAGYKKVKVEFIQRYDISNHLKWLKEGQPGGKGFYDHLFSYRLNEIYVEELKAKEKTDTIMAICSV